MHFSEGMEIIVLGKLLKPDTFFLETESNIVAASVERMKQREVAVQIPNLCCSVYSAAKFCFRR
jgi:hypothetical protein